MLSSTTARTEPSAGTRLETLADVRNRYELAGPHVTVIVPVPTPGTVGDDFGLRWNATMADLHHLGASRQAVVHMDALVASTERRGHPLLLTANDDSAVGCWLGFGVEPSMVVGSLPALVPAIQQVMTASSPTIAASVDRIGANIYSIDGFDITHVASVDGEDEQIHKAASGGWSQKRHQRHSEVLWERNAALVASEIRSQVARLGANAVLLTGDERAARLVESDVTLEQTDAVVKCRAGGRHEPGTVERLLRASLDERRERAAAVVADDLASLREELAQHDQAIDGAIRVLEAIAENRVGTLFVDSVEGRRDTNVDAIVRTALDHGARLVVGADFDVHDGIAALLRVPYE